MLMYTLNHPDKGLIQYRDKKRYWWLLSLLIPMIPTLTIAAYFQVGSPWVLIVPLVFSYVFVPFFDVVFGRDTENPPEEIVPLLDADHYYKYLTYALIPLHFISLFVAVWFIGTEPLSLGFYLCLALITGMNSGFAINTAHEIGHKNTKLDRLLSRIALAVPAYGHFCVEHNFGHHRDVATPEDPASSRMGESIYRFALREIPGAAVRGCRVERDRLQRSGLSVWSINNHILQSYAISLAIHAGAVTLFGWIVLPFLLIHNLFAWLQLTSANYIEHYGLKRAKKANGKYEPCRPHHSWNANHRFSNLALFQLERHSDHHANASRPYQSLRTLDNLPELPSGYFGCYFLAYIPPLWFRLMDERLLSVPHISGDFDQINIDPKREAKLRARYESPMSATASLYS